MVALEEGEGGYSRREDDLSSLVNEEWTNQNLAFYLYQDAFLYLQRKNNYNLCTSILNFRDPVDFVVAASCRFVPYTHKFCRTLVTCFKHSDWLTNNYPLSSTFFPPTSNTLQKDEASSTSNFVPTIAHPA